MKSKPNHPTLAKFVFVFFVFISALIFSSCSSNSFYLRYPNPPPTPDTLMVENALLSGGSDSNMVMDGEKKYPNPPPTPDTLRVSVAIKINPKKADFELLAKRYPNPPPTPDTLRFKKILSNKIGKMSFYYLTEKSITSDGNLKGKILDDKGKIITQTEDSKKTSLTTFQIDSLNFVKATFYLEPGSKEKTKYLRVFLPVYINNQLYWLESVWSD